MNFLHRHVADRIAPWMGRDEIIFILGGRQTGKTCLLRILQRTCEENGLWTAFVDLEDIEIRSAFKSARGFVDYLIASGWNEKKRGAVFLDEIHLLQEYASILKLVHDHFPVLKIFATGSSSLKIKLGAGEAMTGRKAVFTLYGLSFDEYLTFSGRADLEAVLRRRAARRTPEPYSQQICHAYEEFLVYGGYPKVAAERNREMKVALLKEIYSAYIDKEIRHLVKEENLTKFGALVEFLAAQNGGLLSVLEISRQIGLARETVERYVTVLRHTYAVEILRPYFTNRQKEITKSPKLYFLDTGLLNFVLKDFRPLRLRNDAGRLAETQVHASLLRTMKDADEIFFHRTKAGAEIDFLRRSGSKMSAFEVKWSDNVGAVGELCDWLGDGRASAATVISKLTWATRKVGRKTLKIAPAWTVGLGRP